MRVIILAAGIGSRLKPFTENTPKGLFRLGKEVTILERMVNLVKRHSEAEICVVTGFLHERIENLLSGVSFVYNPFYRVTNSIASLWFAREYLDDDVIITNSDIVVEERLFIDVLKIGGAATVLMDSSKKYDADYKVATYDDRVVIMSKELRTYSGEYAGITKLSKDSALQLRRKIEAMVEEEQIDDWKN
jgi:choline kinase